MSNYEDGAKAEFAVAEMLMGDGWRIAYAPNLDGVGSTKGAPLVRGDDDRDIMPDIYAMGHGRTAWVEVKLKKSGAEYIHKNDQYEHFIDAPNWKDYNEVKDASGCEVWLFIIEAPEQTVQRQLVEDVSVVGWWSEINVEQCDGAKYGGPGVFVPQSDFIPADIPPSLAGEISEQRQLRGTVDTGCDMLPDMNADDSDSPDAEQHGLGDFATDGGKTDAGTDGGER